MGGGDERVAAGNNYVHVDDIAGLTEEVDSETELILPF